MLLFPGSLKNILKIKDAVEMGYFGAIKGLGENPEEVQILMAKSCFVRCSLCFLRGVVG